MCTQDTPTADTERFIPDSMDPSIVAEIDRRLKRLGADEGVRIVLAVESGSRAWGFPSADSDYDCRFVYVRRRRDYAALFPKRDVIELPIEGDLDINGWDISKATKLLHNGNAVVVEWLTSPIVYTAATGFRARFLELAEDLGNRDRFALHYYHRARREVASASSVHQPSVKRMLYLLRSVMALRWLRLNSERAVLPMHFPALCDGADLDPALRHRIDQLIAAKANLREVGALPVPAGVAELIDEEMARFTPPTPASPAPDKAELAEAFFRAALERFAPPD